MKKFIALLLALVMCMGMFAGCDKPAANTGLADAKTYLETIYKDESEITGVDYIRVGAVMIGDVSYAVTWAVDKDSIKITSDGKFYTVDVPDTLEEIPYTITATITDAEGNTETVSFSRKVPAALGLPTEIADGTYVILSNNLTLSSLAETSGYGYPTANEVTVADGAVSGHFKADVLTITNVEGGVTIQDAYGRYFYLKGTYNSFNVDATAPEAGHVWKVLANGDNYLLVNAMNNKTLAYSTSYSSWGAYPEMADDHNYMLSIIPATAPEADPTPDVPDVPDVPADTVNGTLTDTVANGDKVVIYYPDSQLAISGTAEGNKLAGVAATITDSALTSDGAAAWDVVVDENGYYTFILDGKYLTSGETGNSLSLADAASDYSLWILEACDGGYYIKNANAAYNGNGQYMEYYNAFTTYGFNDTKTNIYTFQFYKVAAPAASEAPADGENVKIYYPDGDSYVTSTADGNKLAAGAADAAAVWTITVDADGYYTFVCDGKYLTSGETGNSLSLADAASDYSLWELIPCEGGFYIRNVNAAYNGNANQHLEYYNGFTTYGLNETKANIYTFQFEVVGE